MMWSELALRFLIGGAVVTLFALAGEAFKPKTFAGIFGAAPSVALASLGLAFWRHGAGYAGEEARSMIAGSVALGVYSAMCAAVCRWRKIPVWLGAGISWTSWLIVALGLLNDGFAR